MITATSDFGFCFLFAGADFPLVFGISFLWIGLTYSKYLAINLHYQRRAAPVRVSKQTFGFHWLPVNEGGYCVFIHPDLMRTRARHRNCINSRS